ncbi:hypothetical protein CIB48_g10823 [Xylaria polymorpha]|nr:hypothetical protein CIB48_g10823 [Xylaria polymorpha]
MTPRCRRSARIASASTSKRSKDSPAPQQLASVTETHDTYETPSKPSSRIAYKLASSPMPVPTTPSGAAPLKLAMSEMHPSKVHPTMGPPSSGLRHGFTDIDYTKTPMQTLIQNTPSKTPVPSSDFTFRSARPVADKELGPEARRIMDSLRDEAAAIKAQMVAELARKRAEERKSSEGRKIAAAKGKSGRFSQVHMAEFKKMDSIEGHASSFRAAPGRFTPVKATAAPVMPITPLKPGIKRSQSKANLGEPDSARPRTVPPRLLSRSMEDMGSPHTAKRVRQHKEDDASTRRPVTRDGTLIPRPKSSGNDSLSIGIPRSQTLGNLMTPTKSSLARTGSLKTPTITLISSPSQPDLQKVNSFSAKVGTALARSPSKTNLETLARSPSKKHFGLKWGLSKNSASGSSSVPSRIETPGRFDRLKSILKRHPSGTKPKSSIPQLAASVANTPTRLGVTADMFPSVPLTTPGQKHHHHPHVDFTPETKKAAMAQNSPSPVKSSIPRSTTVSKLPAPKFTAGGKGDVSQKSTTGEVTYPDLSAYQADGDEPEHLPESVPGTFTFRSDHTIQVDDSPFKGFGSSADQASLRQVRKSTAPSTQMPGSFPRMPEMSPNKENDAPFTYNGIPHGMSNKKRHRASSDDEDDDEGSKRGMKKLRKNPPVVEGHALVAPRLVGLSSPTKKAMGSTPQTPSPQKKKTGLSLSRLQMLAQPKIRK